MDLDLTPAQLRLRDTARAIDFALVARGAKGWAHAAAAGLGDHLVLGEQDALALAIAVEEVSAASPLAGVVAWATTALFLTPLAGFPISTRGREILASVTAGRAVGGLALAEDPNEAAGPRAHRTSVAREPDGTFVVRGEKRFVILGHEADHLLVVGASGEQGGATAALVDRGASGLSVTEDDGRAATLSFDGVRVAPDAIVGAVGQGNEVAAAALARASVALAAHAVGLGRGALDRAADRLRARRTGLAGGDPKLPTAGDLQLATFSIADMATELDAARLLVHRGALAGGVAADVAKLFATETAIQITLRATRILGRDAATASCELAAYLEAARNAELDGAPGDVLRTRIARSLSPQGTS